MAMDFDGFFFDHREYELGELKYVGTWFPAYMIYDGFFIDHRTFDFGTLKYIQSIPIIIPIPQIDYDGFFIDHRFDMPSDDGVFRLEWIPIVIPEPKIIYTGAIYPHWIEPEIPVEGDTAFFLIRSYPVPVVDFGISCHVTFVNRKTRFYNNSTGDVFLWDFGDGGGSNRREPFHIYRKAGTYTVKLCIDGFWYTSDNQVIVFENNYILDSGAVFLNYGEKNAVCLGATEGGNAFGIENEIRYMSFDGEKGNIAGAHRLIGSVPKIVANMIEVNYRLLNIALPGSEITFNSGSVTIKRAIRRLLKSDYIKNIAIVAEHGGTGCFIVFKIKNAVTIENIEIPFEDGNESVIICTFAGCFTPENADVEPWEIDFQIA